MGGPYPGAVAAEIHIKWPNTAVVLRVVDTYNTTYLPINTIFESNVKIIQNY